LLLLDRRQFDEAGQARLPRHADADDVAAQGVVGQELLQRLADELVGVGVGLAEDLGILDVVEGGGDDLAVDLLQSDRLEGTLPQVDAPDTGCWLCHEGPPGARFERSKPAPPAEQRWRRKRGRCDGCANATSVFLMYQPGEGAATGRQTPPSRPPVKNNAVVV